MANNPDLLDFNPQWSLRQPEGKGKIRVRMDDPNFHFGTMYYMSLQNMDDELRATNLKVTVKQLRAVEKIPNGVPKKF